MRAHQCTGCSFGLKLNSFSLIGSACCAAAALMAAAHLLARIACARGRNQFNHCVCVNPVSISLSLACALGPFHSILRPTYTLFIMSGVRHMRALASIIIFDAKCPGWTHRHTLCEVGSPNGMRQPTHYGASGDRRCRAWESSGHAENARAPARANISLAKWTRN